MSDTRIPSRKEPEKKLLGTQDAGSSLWLLKIPNYIAERWANNEPNDILGNLGVTSVNDTTMGPPTKKIKLKLLSGSDADKQTVDDFIVEELKGGPQLFAFSYNDSTESFSVSGKVTKNCTLMPENVNTYGTVQTEIARLELARRPQVVRIDQRALRSDPSTVVPFILPIVEGKKSAGSSAVSSMAAEKTEIMETLFGAFKKEPHLTLKELQQVCSCSEQDLRPLLTSYCVYNKKGSFKFYYELKPEFKAD